MKKLCIILLAFSGLMASIGAHAAVGSPCNTQKAYNYDNNGSIRGMFLRAKISDQNLLAQLGPCQPTPGLGDVTVYAPPDAGTYSGGLTAVGGIGNITSTATNIGDGGGGNQKQSSTTTVNCPPGVPKGTICTTTTNNAPNNVVLVTHGWTTNIEGYFSSAAACSKAGNAWVSSINASGGWLAFWGVSFTCVTL